MSRDGQGGAASTMPAGLVVDLVDRGGFEWHSHAEHQLALVSSGVLSMAVGDRSWVLPSTRALFIPSGVVHSVLAHGDTRMLSVYVPPERCPVEWCEPTVVAADGLVGELARYLSDGALAPEPRTRAEAVLWDLLAPLPTTTLTLPLPVDDRARRVADGVLDDVADDRTLEEWGAAVGASARTLARVFVAETGVGFARWRTAARVAAALPHLAEGRAVALVARDVGYANPSAFVAAFRREVGVTPAQYFAR